MTRRVTRATELRFPGLSRPIHLHNAPGLMSALCHGLSGWVPTVSATVGAADPAPVATVSAEGDHHAIRSIWLDAPLTGLSTTGAICGIVADLSQSWVAERPDHLALHAGGVAIDGRLYALSGEARAGKSTLMARLTAERWARVLCDDVLPLDPQDRGIALGIPPRLRLPLPGAATPAFRAHVKDNLGSFDRQYAYLAPATVVPHGTTVPLSAFVVLTRRKVGPARLHTLPEPEAVAHLLARNMAETATDPALIARLSALTGRIACLRLVYSDLEDAVALLHALAVERRPGLIGPALGGGEDLSPPPAPPVGMDRPFRRTPEVGLVQTVASTYLLNRAGNSCHALNPLGLAVWTLLEEPTSGAEIVDVLTEVYPDTPPATIRKDVADLLALLAATGLILPG